MPRKKWATVGLVAVLAALLLTHQAVAFIQKLFPLQEFIDDSDFLFTAKVEPRRSRQAIGGAGAGRASQRQSPIHTHSDQPDG